MGRYAIRRLLQFVPVFVIATFLVYFLVFSLGGDPIRALAGDKPLDPAVVARLRAEFNLDDPIVVQYLKYMAGVFTGDLGTTFNGREVSEILAQRLPTTLKLASIAFVFELVIGITAGIVAGIRRKSFIDVLVSLTTVGVIAIPIFVLGYTLQLLLGVNLGWFPVVYRGTFFSLFLPGIVLGLTSLAYIARLTRTSLVENLRADYVRTARAKGLSPKRVIGIHAMRNSMIPVVTFLAVDIGGLMGGAIVTEGIFNVPGIGRAVFDGISSREGATVVGIVTFLIVVYMVFSLLVDFLYAVLDPRIRYE